MEASPKLALMPFARDPISFDGSSMALAGNRCGSLTDDIVEKRRLRRTITGAASRPVQAMLFDTQASL